MLAHILLFCLTWKLNYMYGMHGSMIWHGNAYFGIALNIFSQ